LTFIPLTYITPPFFPSVLYNLINPLVNLQVSKKMALYNMLCSCLSHYYTTNKWSKDTLELINIRKYAHFTIMNYPKKFKQFNVWVVCSYSLGKDESPKGNQLHGKLLPSQKLGNECTAQRGLLAVIFKEQFWDNVLSNQANQQQKWE